MKLPLVEWLAMRGKGMTKEQWEELKTNTLKEWLAKKHPATLKMWEDHFSDLIDLDMWLEEYHGWLDQKFQACLEREE